MPTTIVIITLVLIVAGTLPTWSYSEQWGYGPSAVMGSLLIIVIVLLLTTGF